MKKYNQAFLFFYSLLVTIAFITTGFMGFKAADPDKQVIKELITERIKIVEPDGTLRMVISDRSKLPGIIVRGKEIPYDRPQAGMLFYNDEGSENGGLIFSGSKNSKGEVVNSGGSLSFDRYDAKQEINLIGVNDKEDRFAGMSISDSHPGEKYNPQRIWVGRGSDDKSEIVMSNSTGKKRLVFRVTADGKSSINFR